MDIQTELDELRREINCHSKLTRVESLGIPILTEDMFEEMIR